MGIVYCIFNKTNGKSYIGQTWNTLEQRWSRHIYNSKSPKMPISFAIKKHGEDAFTKTILTEAFTQEDLDSAENYWMDYFDTFQNPKLGYNARRGGSHGKFSEESKKKLSESHKGKIAARISCFGSEWRKLHPEFGVGLKRSDESKEKMRVAKLGKKRSEEARKAVSEGMKGIKAKSVICVNDGKVFSSATEASKYYNVDAARVANGTRKHTKGLIFKYQEKS